MLTAMLWASTGRCVSTGDWPPARGRGHVLEEVTFLLGSQSMRRSFPGRDKGKGSPGRAYFQRHGDRRDHGVSWKWKTVLRGCSPGCTVSLVRATKKWCWRGGREAQFWVCLLYTVGSQRFLGKRVTRSMWWSRGGGFVEDGLERVSQVAARPAVMNSTWKDPRSSEVLGGPLV